MLPKVITVQEVDCIKRLSSLISNQCNMHLEIERIKKELLDLYGFQELTQHQGL